MHRSSFKAVVAFLLLFYCASYLLLTLRGRYEPVTVSVNQPPTYAWAPQHFTRDYRWDRFKLIFYLPLYCVDVQFWHTRAAIRTGQYPIDVPPKLVPTDIHSSTPPINLPLAKPAPAATP